MISTMLDDDLYKFTMCQAVYQQYPHAQAKYKFINRGDNLFPKGFALALATEVDKLAELSIAEKELQFLRDTCPFLTPVFLDFIKGYRYDPREVAISQYNGGLKVEVTGPWYRTILWEVKLMALISELYFSMTTETAPNLNEAKAKTVWKANTMREVGLKFADFGSRRRYSEQHHYDVVQLLDTYGMENFVGTSNIALAHKFGVKPIGTQAHEWFMFHGAKYGYHDANRMALRKWVDVYHGDLGIALSDTFTTNAFFKAFGSKYAKLFDGVRHDSGDPEEFGRRVIEHYHQLGIDPKTKTIVFSDGLDTKLAVKLHQTFSHDIRCSFGIGTHFTNDIVDVKPLNMVIKMTHCKPFGEDEWLPVVKLSDTPGKHTGDPEEVNLCKRLLRI